MKELSKSIPDITNLYLINFSQVKVVFLNKDSKVRTRKTASFIDAMATISYRQNDG